MSDTAQEKENRSKISLFEQAFIYIGFVLAILNLIMGVSLQIRGIYSKLGMYRMDPGGIIGTILYALFVIYWHFWFIPFCTSLGINLYGFWKKQRLSAIGIVLSLVGIFVLMISYVWLGGQLPD